MPPQSQGASATSDPSTIRPVDITPPRRHRRRLARADAVLGKSTALATLCREQDWFMDGMPDLSSKDALLMTAGRLIIEFAEFDTLTKHTASKHKAFLSRRVDPYRAPYGQVTEDHPRQWIPAATINPGERGYLVDETGNVRFWCVKCAVGWADNRFIDTDAVRAVRDQLWAEAFHRFQQGERWWFDKDDTELRQAQAEAALERLQTDDREMRIAQALDGEPWATMAGLMMVIGIESDAPH